MKFKVDENLPVEVAQLLGQAGHDAVTVLAQALGGSDDESLARICREEQRAMITLDLDFADIRAYPPEAYRGLIVLRLRRQDKPYVVRIVERLLVALQTEALEGTLWIVDEEHIRIRG